MGGALAEIYEKWREELKHLLAWEEAYIDFPEEEIPDDVFNALHGQYGEDGCVQGVLDIMQIPYTHSGAVTNTPALGAAQQVLTDMNIAGASYDVDWTGILRILPNIITENVFKNMPWHKG